MEIIIFAPPTWQPTIVHDQGTANDWVANRGYRFAPPVETVTEKVVQVDSSLIDINKADLSELATLPKVGIATAKKVISHRPYQTIEDLIALKLDIDWMGISSRISF